MPNNNIVLPDFDEDAYEWGECIEDMLNCGDFDFAEDFLQSVYDGIEKYENITDKQKKAVENIFNSTLR